MALGLLLSAIVNILIGFIPDVNAFFTVLDTEGKATMGFIYLMGSLWLINGWLQGMGYPPCSSLMAYWIRVKKTEDSTLLTPPILPLWEAGTRREV